ncbi:VanZ family protein [Salipaludibacillus sp. HK11]|uniref:VanZ family protein n=1 Tax=Salipaludibacillus sp. HK11 TaxID=3394320 RepID=UPI0039FD1CCE
MKKVVLLSLFYSQLLFLLFSPIWIQLINYLHPIVIVILWFCFSSFVLFIVCWVKNELFIISKHSLQLTILFYGIGLLILLYFRPQEQNYGTVNLVPFETIWFYLSGQVNYLISFYNIGANIGLFVPFGLYYRYVKKNPTIRQLIGISLCSIVAIESFQYLTTRGSLDIDDLILNVLGVYLGYLFQPLVKKVLLIKNTERKI